MEQENLELELIVNKDGKVQNNVDEFCASITAACKKYNYVVTKENYEQAKKDRATLNKVLKAVPRQRIDCEKQILETWKPIKDKVMSSEKEIKTCEVGLGEGIAAIDNAERGDKKMLIANEYSNISFHFVGEIAFEKLLDDTWLNKSTTEKQWKEELQAKINKIVQDETMLELFIPSDEVDAEQVKQTYRNTLDIGQAKLKADNFKYMREEAERKKQLEQSVQEIKEEVPAQKVTVSEMPALINQSKLEKIVVEFIADRAFYDAMNQLIKEHKPRYKILEREDV